MLLNVILISAAVHVVALLILGGITVVRYAIPDDPEFDEPPQIEEQEPPPDVQVEVKPQPSAENQPLDSLRMQQIGEISVAEINVDLPQMEESFTVSGGMGDFGSGGGLLGGASGRVGLGSSDMKVFGIKDTAERVLFVIDAGREMVVDEKGGLNSYRVIKEEIIEMVGNLAPGTLFNVALYDRMQITFFKSKLTPASPGATSELEEWIEPINSDADRVGLQDSKRMEISALPDHPVHDNLFYRRTRANETMVLTQVILEQNADAAFIITGYHPGFNRIRRSLTPREQAEWERTKSQPSYQRQLEKHKKEKPRMRERVKEKLAELNEERKREGLPPKVLSSRYGVYTDANELDLEWETPHPGFEPAHYIEEREVERYFRQLVKKRFRDRGKDTPSVNVVLFLAGDEELSENRESSLRDYVNFFRGRYRIIRGPEEIRRARSAAETEN